MKSGPVSGGKYGLYGDESADIIEPDETLPLQTSCQAVHEQLDTVRRYLVGQESWKKDASRLESVACAKRLANPMPL